MVEINKSKAFIALFVIIIIFLSAGVVPSSQYVPNFSSMKVKGIEGQTLGNNGTEINAISLDIKLQKIE